MKILGNIGQIYDILENIYKLDLSQYKNFVSYV